MSLAKLLKTPATRETPAELEIGGEKLKVTVRYKTVSVKDDRARRALYKTKEASDETFYLSDALAPRVVALIEENGEETPVTLDLLENMAVENLRAINLAIEEANSPK